MATWLGFKALRLRAWRVGLALQLLLALGLCWVPLFDVLGFERAFVSSLLAAPLSAAIAISLTRGARATGGEDPARLALQAFILGALLLLPSVLIGVLVELVKQPCNPGEGALFMLFGGGASAAYGAALGVSAELAFEKRGGRGVALLLMVSLAASLARLYTEPQIFAYSMPFGYWPGSLYDEEVAISTPFLAQRALTLLCAMALIAVARVISDRVRLRRAWRPTARALALAVALSAGALGLAQQGERLGFDLNRGTIDRALSRRVSVPGLELRVDPSVSPAQLARMVEDHRLRYQQLLRFFKQAPAQPLISYIYRDVEQKRRLMGAGTTQISRPWAHEIHINGFSVPHPVLKHELAHAFSGELGGGPFKVPAAGLLLVNIGVVEGLAVAADWPLEGLTIHGWTRAMRALHLAPDPRRTLYPLGFWAISSARAYTTAGSFIRYLIDQYGIETFAQLYRGNDFAEAYGKPLDALASEWERFIDAEPLDLAELSIAEHRFSQPGIFEKVCAHTAANLSAEGYALLEAGDLEPAITRLEQVLRYGPSRIDPLLSIGRALAKQGQLERARGFARRAFEAPGLTNKSRAQARELLADLDWRANQTEAARAGYLAVLELHLSNPSDRLQLAKLAALERPPELQASLRSILLGDLPAVRAMIKLLRMVEARREDGLLAYLLGFRMEQSEAYQEGAEEMQRALALGLPGRPIEREAALALGRMYLRSGQPKRARAQFLKIAETSSAAIDRLTAADWAERAEIVEGAPRDQGGPSDGPDDEE